MALGLVPGIAIGQTFRDRRELYESGVHRDVRRGICGSGIPRAGAESVVLSGAYEDDRDLGELVYYTGQGGRDQRTGEQVADQSFVGPNLSLAINVESGNPVRVVRRTGEGLQFDGLYLVEDAWLEPGRRRFIVCRYRLRRTEPVPTGARASTQAPGPAARRLVSHYRLVRDTAIVARVKALYNHVCQVCGQEIRTLTGRYVEGAHVVPLGGAYGGPDVVENVLCLCPNDHARFDHGGIFISDDFEVFSADRTSLGRLHVHEEHRLDVAYLRTHRRLFGY